MIAVALESPHQPEVEALLHQSDAYARALYPPESNHLVSLDELARPEVRFFVARDGSRAVGCAALVLNGKAAAELKRMFVEASARGHGAGRALVQTIEAAAHREGVRILQLETGIHNHEALALYRRAGFCERPPFGGYVEDPLSVFMEKALV